MLPDDFQKSWFSRFRDMFSIRVGWYQVIPHAGRRVLRTPLPLPEGVRQVMKNDVSKSLNNHADDVLELLNIPMTVSKWTWMFPGDFQKSWFSLFSRHFLHQCWVIPGDPTCREESASHPSPSTRGSAPSSSLMCLLIYLLAYLAMLSFTYLLI